MNGAHWSFNYFHDPNRTDITPIHVKQKPAFLRILRTYREQAYPIELQGCSSWSAAYAMLFNWTPAYARPADGVSLLDLQAGELAVKKTVASSKLVHYSITFADVTSGEEGSADFTCSNDLCRELKDDWQVSIRNTADGIYSDYDLRGRIVTLGGGKREIELGVCGSAYASAGIIPTSIPCSSFWALFDAQSFLEGGETLAGRRRTALLERMEHLRPANIMGYLEDFDLQIDKEVVHLRGYYVHGTGVTPRYYWLDDRGHVAIVSGLYTTWVLQRAVSL